MTRCHQCQRELPADAAGGICPACLLVFARGNRQPAAAAQPATLDRGSHPANREATYPGVAELNQRLPQFRFFEMIGSGGMGAVYKALQVNLDRPVAIKIMSPEVANDPSFAERFAREAKTLARLSHQHIVNVYDFGQNGNLYYLVMEYIDGVNLRQAIRAGQISAAQALAVVPQVCEALQFAHDEGIIHRDIKPENILLDRKGRVKIADFGLAKLVAQDTPSWTLTGSRQVLGTVHYMAPEQMEHPTDVDHRADIYSLGVVLYELLTGELPLGRFQLPGEKNVDWAPLDEVVVRTLEKKPDRRFQRASEFKTAVEHACSQSGFRPIGPDRQPLPVSPAAHVVGGAAKKPDAPSARVPFSIDNPWHGMTVTHGVLKTTATGLLVDYAKRETVFQSQIGGPGQYEIPFEWILKIDFIEGWFSNQLVLSMDSPRDLPGMPTDKPGLVTLSVQYHDGNEARTLVNEVRRHNRQPLLSLPSQKPEEQLGRARAALRGPAIALFFAGAINLLVLPLLILALVFSARMVRSETGTPPVQTPSVSAPVNNNQNAPEGLAEANPHNDTTTVPPSPHQFESIIQQPSFTMGTLLLNSLAAALWFAIGVLIITGGLQMTSVKHWGWCLAMSIVALVPLHPGFIIGLPAGICSLVQLSRHSVRAQFRLNQQTTP